MRALTRVRAMSCFFLSALLDIEGIAIGGGGGRCPAGSGFRSSSGRNLRVREWLGALMKSPLIPDRLVISEALFPEARATRKAVL